MRACNAMRVFSGSTVTGPLRSAARTNRSKISRIAGGLPAKCASSVPSGAQVWVWLRFANARPQSGHVQRLTPRGRGAWCSRVTTRGSTNCST